VGQKVHPLGFRLHTTQTHQSIWFTKFKNYPSLLEEDFKIRTCIGSFSFAKNSGISKIEITRNSVCNKIKVSIFAVKPGFFVGTSGENLAKVYQILSKFLLKNKVDKLVKLIDINVISIDVPDSEASIIGTFIVEQLEKRVVFRRVLKKAVARSQFAKNIGIRIEISGRLNGAEIARKEWIRDGRVPLHTLRANIDYTETQAKTIYGLLGVKVWLFKGEIL